MRRFLVVIALLLMGLFVMGYSLGRGWLGVRQAGGTIAAGPVDVAWTGARAAEQVRAADQLAAPVGKQILFGDLHVHTTYSFDAFMVSLPMFQGEGAHPPADACDFARYCSGLDFWSINDHAEGLTPFQWQETKRVVRECQAASGDPAAPDLVSFLGWEWTQIGVTPEDHYGHKNVVLRDLEEARIPARPISSREDLIPDVGDGIQIGPALRALLIATSPGSDDRQPYLDAARFLEDRDRFGACPAGVGVRDLPLDCQEGAGTPGELFAKLDDWGFPYLVIPHGNTWGFYSPPGISWDKQLLAHRDPDLHEPLFEVFSGHGNAEEYRDWRAVVPDGEGGVRCPEPTDDYLPSCWRAGEIIRERCVAAGENDVECESRAHAARKHYAEAGTVAHMTVPGVEVEDWLDAGQCRDCYMPAFNYRPAGSGQYALAITDFDDVSETGEPKRFRFGFIASSDNHTARPGTGYKELDRREMTEAGLGGFGSFVSRLGTPKEPRSVPIEEATVRISEFERFASFFGSGGLVAVHSGGRDRGAIWDALQRKEVYGTSGDRILLWFDAWPGSGERSPMGSAIEAQESPRFEVRAAGAFHQEPGCPDHSVAALPAERLDDLCRGECYHPSDRRKRIERIEVVRIRPQVRRGEPVADLVEDPWKVLPCEDSGAGCTVEFRDPDYASSARDVVYYVRAVQEASPTINADQLRCEYDGSGQCASVDPCSVDESTDYQDDCLAPAEERAWSSPIFLRFPRPTASQAEPVSPLPPISDLSRTGPRSTRARAGV